MIRIWQPTHRMLIQHDPLIGHRYVPGIEVRVPNELGGARVRTNGQGFRSDLDFLPERNGHPRILFFGDSYTAGDGVSNGERFAERAGEALGAEVYNYGLSGSGTDQQLLVLEHLASGVEADLVVLAVLAENIERNKVDHRLAVDRATGRRVSVPKPHFTLTEEGRLVLEGVPVPARRVEASSVDGTERFGSHRRDPRLALLYKAVDRYRSSEHARAALDPMLGRLRPLFVRAAGFQPFPDYLDVESEGWRLLRALLERAFDLAAPVPVLLVPLPTYHNLLDGVPPVFQRRFESLADPARGVHVADVARPLHGLSRAERRRLLFEHDVHFSPHGHAVVADLLTRAITDLGLLPRKAARPVRPLHRHTSGSGWVLGISGYYHDSAAALVKDGQVVAAAQEERFTRVKNDRRFPHQAVAYCLERARINPSELQAVAYYDSAALTFERLIHTALALGPSGSEAWQRFLPSWLETKLWVARTIRESLCYDGPVRQDLHHRSHAASAFYPSPFEDAAILTVDGVGEWSTASIGVGEGRRLDLLREMHFPHSLGLLYSAFTQFTGFKVNQGEYKMMGLAPYGEPRYVDAILEHVVDLKEDGSVELDLSYFDFLQGVSMTGPLFAELFDGPARPQGAWITRREADIACSVQVVIEEAILRMARYARKVTGKKRLCLAGGVALNCVANGRLLREGIFDDLWIQPAAGDAGGALGAALDVWHTDLGRPRTAAPRDAMHGARLGPEYSNAEIEAFLASNGLPYRHLDPEDRADTVSALLEAGKIVGHFSGRMEYGPRALGGRSILGDARLPEMQASLNLKIKYRESFRPFAPVVLQERAREYFEIDRPSPYMLLVAPVERSRRLPALRKVGEPLTETVRRARSDIPAVTHVDYSARIQTVNAADHPDLAAVLAAFEARTGCPVLVNTSFNVRGEPIVATPYDAYRCFMRTEMDALVLGDLLLLKIEQPAWPERGGEEETATAPPAPVPRRLSHELRRIFRTRLLPLAERLRASGEIKVDTRRHGEPSLWRPVTATTRDRIFGIPEALDRPGASPPEVAEAICRSWGVEPLPLGLVSLVEALVAATWRHPVAKTADETVPDSVYVMF